jgi:enoyl-CoA hydratase/carnithine racemase
MTKPGQLRASSLDGAPPATGATVRQFGDHVRLEVAGGVATLRLDRPPMNALDIPMQQAIRVAAEAAGRDPAVAAVVLWGGERVFAAGADIKQMSALSYPDMVVQAADLQAVMSAVAAIPKPVCAAITGYALGGGLELALGADVRFCAPDAKLGQPEIKLGIIPGAGGTQRLSRLVGPARTKDIVFTGRFVGAAEAERIGLVDRIEPAERVYAAAREWAGGFVGGPSLALRAAKAAIDRGLDVDLGTGLEIESQHFAALFATEDRSRGMASFIEHGPGRATFVGR